MYDGLWVNDDLDLLRRNIEKPPCFDNLQSLVHHRGRIHRDLGSHIPVGMIQRFLQGYRRKCVQRPIPERSTRCGKNQLPNACRALPNETLIDGRVLAIHRQNIGLMSLGNGIDQVAGDNHGLLVGQSDAPSLPESC